MEDNKINTANNKTSNVRRKNEKKVNGTSLSNDELLEQILNKKRNKKKSNSINNRLSTSAVKKNNANSNLVSKKNSVNKKTNELSSDELYELIKSKRNKQSSKKKNNISKQVVEDKKKIISDVKNNFINEKNDNKNNDDLIITREITFTEDAFDINNKSTLDDLKKAIEEFDALDDYVRETPLDDIEPDEDLFNFENKTKNKISFKNNKTNFIYFLLFLILFVVVVFIIVLLSGDNESTKLITDTSYDVKDEVDERPRLYQECLKSSTSDVERTDEIIAAEVELTNYLSSTYKMSVIYEDLTFGYRFSYNPDMVYYAASVIKALDALYIYSKASSGDINLDDTIKYTSKYKLSPSAGMKNHKLGEKVSLRTLVKYAVTVSDNSAHEMLIDYIGKNNLKNFGKSLGAQYTLYGGDNFGHIIAEDGIIYMKAINDFINNNDELGEELKSYFIQADQNALEIPDLGIKAAHKYGEYTPYYNDIGIVYDSRPYVISILSTEKKGDFVGKISDVNKRIYELHQLYYKNKEKVCHDNIYGK